WARRTWAARASAALPTCQLPVPALVTRTASLRPRRCSWSANIFSAIAERQMLPVQTNVMCSGLGSDTQHPPQLVDGRGMCHDGGPGGRVPVGEVGLPVAPADHHGVDAVCRRAVHVVAAIADHEHALG